MILNQSTEMLMGVIMNIVTQFKKGNRTKSNNLN